MSTRTAITSEPSPPSYVLTNDTNFSVSWEVLTVVGALICTGIGLGIKCYIQHEKMRVDVSDIKYEVDGMRTEIKSDGIDMRKENKEEFKELKMTLNRLEMNMSLFSTVVGRLEQDLEQVKEYIKNSDIQLQENKSKNTDLEWKYQSIVEDLKNIHSLLQKVERHDKTIEDMIRRIDNLRHCDI